MSSNGLELLLQNQDFTTMFQSEAEHIDITELFDGIKDEIKSNILTQFGISHFFDNYQKGGPVTTLHNAKINVFAHADDEERFNNQFKRTEYEGRKIKTIDKDTGKIKVISDTTLSRQRKDRFQNDLPLKDEYTGRELNRDGSTHLDHITSAKAIHSRDDLRLFMSDTARNDLAVSEENMAFINGRMNQSKGEHDLIEWMETTQKKQTSKNINRFEIDEEMALKKAGQSKNFIEQEAKSARREYYIQNTTKTVSKQTISQGKKQVVGVIIYEVSDMFFNVTTPILKNWHTFSSMTARNNEFNERCKVELAGIEDKVKLLMKKIVISGSGGMISGFISTITNILINTFVTTTASFAKILCDGIEGVIRAFKVLNSKDPSITKQEKIKKAIEIIGTAIVASAGILISQAISKQLLATPLAPFAEEIGAMVGLVITGFFTAALIYSVENFGAICSQVKECFALMEYGVRVTREQIENEYITVINKIDDAYKLVLKKIETEYAEVKNLQEMVRDFTLLADVQLKNSVSYALKMGVLSENVIVDEKDIDNYFM
jgi:hypothetical protein